MQTLIISDTTCLVILEKIGHLEILKHLYGTVTITTLISKEFKKILPDWIHIRDPADSDYVHFLSQIVDPGEASAIALSAELENCVLILDDLKARKLASELQLKFTGTLGIILFAKNKGLLGDMDLVIAKIQDSNFRLSKNLIEKLKSNR